MAHMLKEEAAGRVKPYDPAAAKPREKTGRDLLPNGGLPDHVATLALDPAQTLANTISKSMWTSNPGYIVRDGPRLSSVGQSDYVWDEEAIQYLKGQGMYDKEYNVKRDDFVLYAEALARTKLLAKGK